MDSKLNQWLCIKTALEDLKERKKLLTDNLKEVETVLVERYLSNGEKVTKEGFTLQVVNKPMAVRVKKSEKIAMMAGSLAEMLKHPPSDKEGAVKNMLEACKTTAERKVLIVKKKKD